MTIANYVCIMAAHEEMMLCSDTIKSPEKSHKTGDNTITRKITKKDYEITNTEHQRGRVRIPRNSNNVAMIFSFRKSSKRADCPLIMDCLKESSAITSWIISATS